MDSTRKLRRWRLVWAFLLCVSFPLAIALPFIDAYFVKHVPSELTVPFDFGAALLSISSILFGFTSLIIISKEWVDKRVWTVLIPPLVMIVVAGVSISNLALSFGNAVETLLFCSAAFNANVVSTGFIVGYVTMMLPSASEFTGVKKG
ncbi:MAG: hypothetical protein ACM3WQ_04480 [Chloroflexota bacterium]